MLLLAAVLSAGAQAPAWQSAVATQVGIASNLLTAEGDNGTVYVAGTFSETISLGDFTLRSTGGYDIFVAKWSESTKSFVWVQQAGGPTIGSGGSKYGLEGNDYASAIVVSGNNVYVGGQIGSFNAAFGAISVHNSSQVYSISNAGTGIYQDGFVAKLMDRGSTGEFTWVKQLQGKYDEGISTLAAVGSTVYMGGSFSSPAAVLDGISLASTRNNVDNSGSTMFVAKLLDSGPAGTVTWGQRAGSRYSSAYASVSKLAVTNTSVYVAGNYDAVSGDYMTFGGTAITLASGKNDVYVAKLKDTGTAGTFSWAQAISGAGQKECTALVANGSNVYVAGVFDGPTASVGTSTLANAGTGTNDLFIIKLTDADSTASLAWAQRAGGPAADALGALTVQGNQLYLGGSFAATATLGTANLLAQGQRDAFVLNLSDEGTTTTTNWVQQAGSPGMNKVYVSSIALERNSIYVSGFLNGTAAFGNLSLTLPASGRFLATLSTMPLATAHTQLAASIELYPNPARGITTVQVPAGMGRALAALSLLDATGRVVRTATAPAGQPYALALAGLAPGLYALKVQVGEALAMRQLVVE